MYNSNITHQTYSVTFPTEQENYEKDLQRRQEEHLRSIRRPWQPCMHNSCPECLGTGMRRDGTSCIHCLSCPCPRCSTYCMC